MNLYLHRLQLHLKTLARNLAPQAVVAPSPSQTNGTQQIFRDRFGIRKLLLFLSKSGKLVALDSERATVVWERLIKSDAIIAGLLPERTTLEGRELLLVRSTAEGYPPVVSIILAGKAGGDSWTVVQTINAMDGHDFGLTPIKVVKADLESSFILPTVSGAECLHLVALIDSEQQVRIVPENGLRQSDLDEADASFYYFAGKTGDSVLRGFRVGLNKDAPNPLQAEEVWRVELPTGETVAAIGKKPGYGTPK